MLPLNLSTANFAWFAASKVMRAVVSRTLQSLTGPTWAGLPQGEGLWLQSSKTQPFTRKTRPPWTKTPIRPLST